MYIQLVNKQILTINNINFKKCILLLFRKNLLRLSIEKIPEGHNSYYYNSYNKYYDL